MGPNHGVPGAYCESIRFNPTNFGESPDPLAIKQLIELHKTILKLVEAIDSRIAALHAQQARLREEMTHACRMSCRAPR